MAVHKHNSWGRTRSPKNIAGDPGTAVALEANTNNLRSSNAGYKLVGYATENQRFLHLLVTDANESGSPGNINVFGYCHAFEKWFEIPQSFDPVGANSAPTATQVSAANSGRAESAQVPSDREYRVYEIAGVDRVAFVGDDGESNVYAACSTF
jgi:hypothetical protein